MRVAIVSDIHGNLRAFRAVLADLRQVTPDIVVHGGDLAYGGTHAAEIIDQVRSLGWPGVRGNTDEMLWAPESLAAFAATAPKLAPLLAILQELIPPTLASIGRERLRWLRRTSFSVLPTRLHLSSCQPKRPVASSHARCKRRRIAKYLRVCLRANRGLWSYPSSIHTPAFRADCGKFGKRQPIL